MTDDAGRYVLPQLPTATYNVWVRGYGLVDSTTSKGGPAIPALNLTAKLASYAGRGREGLSRQLLVLAARSRRRRASSRAPARAATAFRRRWRRRRSGSFNIKSGCNFCHQLGNEITRSLGHMDHLGFKTPEEAWIYRTQLGVRGSVDGRHDGGVRPRAPARASWPTGRRASRTASCRRCRRGRGGLERNVVVTLWDWGVDNSFMHDEIATDKNDPTVNGYGPVYAVSAGHGKLTVLDPIENDAYEITIPTREDPRQVQLAVPAAARCRRTSGACSICGASRTRPIRTTR